MIIDMARGMQASPAVIPASCITMFRKDDVAVLEQGVVRLSARLARDVAALTIKAVPLARMWKWRGRLSDFSRTIFQS